MNELSYRGAMIHSATNKTRKSHECTAAKTKAPFLEGPRTKSFLINPMKNK